MSLYSRHSLRAPTSSGLQRHQHTNTNSVSSQVKSRQFGLPVCLGRPLLSLSSPLPYTLKLLPSRPSDVPDLIHPRPLAQPYIRRVVAYGAALFLLACWLASNLGGSLRNRHMAAHVESRTQCVQ